MTTQVSLGDGKFLVQDENVLSPQNNNRNTASSSTPTSPKATPNIPSKSHSLTVDTGSSSAAATADPHGAAAGISADSRDDHTNRSSLVYSADSSDNDFSIDRYGSYGDSLEDKGSSLDSLSIEHTDTDNLERMMAKFDDAQAPTFEEEPTEDEANSIPVVSETPKTLNQMLEKFDLLKSSSIEEPHQDKMMAKFDKLQKSKIETPRMDFIEKADDSEIYRDKKLFEVLSPSSQGAVEVKEEQAFVSYSQSNSYSSNEMFADIEQFRSAESHLEHDSSTQSPVLSPAAASDTNATISSAIDSNTQKILEQRIVSLMNQVSTLEIERVELRSQKDEIQAQLNVQHDNDVGDMYQNPYSNPFAPSSPTKSSGGAIPSFLATATSNLQQSSTGVPASASMGALSSSTIANNGNNELHREMTELRMKNQTLQADLETSDRIKERLKKILKTVQEEDKQKQDMLKDMTKELDESKEREAVLKNELDDCKVRLSGFEMAQKQKGESDKDYADKPSFFSSSSEAKKKSSTQTGDVATALVVSQKQNEALEAFNKELELQNTTLQQKCDSLTEKYGLSVPADGDDKGKQLYSRYLEAKSSLTSMSVTLEEAQQINSELSDKVKKLESEVNEQKPSGSDHTVASDAAPSDTLKSIFSSTSASSAEAGHNAITAEQEAALKGLVEKLEEQILGYREAQERHDEIVAQLDQEASELRMKLKSSEMKATSFATTPELECCYDKLKSKISSSEMNSELKSELESLKHAMEAAEVVSTKLLSKTESLLESTREELYNEKTRLEELDAKHKTLLRIISKENSTNIVEENDYLQTQVSTLQKETKKLKNEVEQKTSKIEKSEKRVTAKHEQALQLTQANLSLRDGIQKLKVHLSSISEQASKTEAKLTTNKRELDMERERSQKLEVAHGTLQAKLKVIQKSIDGTTDKDVSKKIKLTASLAASKTELSLEKKRVKKLLETKKDLESALDYSKEDMQTQMHIHQKKASEFESEICSLEHELDETKLVVAAATLKLTKLSDAKSKESIKIQGLLESTRELLSAEKAKVDSLKSIKSSLESKLNKTMQNFEELQSSNATLEGEMESWKQRATCVGSESSHQFSELEKLLATTQEELNEEEKQVESLEKQVDSLTQKVQELEQCKSDLQGSLEDAKEEMKTLASQIHSTMDDKKDDTENDNVSVVSRNLTSTLTIERNNTASTDVRLWEAEMLLSHTKRDLKEVLAHNKKLTGEVGNLETSIEKSQQTNVQTLHECETHSRINKEMADTIDSLKIDLATLAAEKESLLKRMAALARRDQLQKASLVTSNDEIAKLMSTVSEFQGRFETLAEQVEHGQAEKDVQMLEYETQEAKWISENAELNYQMDQLQKKCDKIQKEYDEIESKRVQAVMKQQSDWQTERVTLNKRLALLEKPDNDTGLQQQPNSSAYYPIQQCNTDRSLLNQKMCELEQDINLLEVTMDDKKQEHLVATAELEVAKRELEVSQEELEKCQSEMQSLVVKSAIDQEGFQDKIRELEEELDKKVAVIESGEKVRESIRKDHVVAQTILDASKEELNRCRNKLDDRDKQIEDLQSKYYSCKKDLDLCKSELKEKEAVMRELAKKQVEQLDGDDNGRSKQALALLTDELNEAHIREKGLEDELYSYKKQLVTYKKQLETFENKVSEEKFGAGVYKDVIAKLTKSNDNLEAKNQKLKEESRALKIVAKALKNDLKQEKEISRIVAGGNNSNDTSTSSVEVERENSMMKDLLATSQLSVTEAKNMQEILSNQVRAATKRETKLTKEILGLKARNADIGKRLEEQEQELDEFESDFALARNDARKVVDELRSQLVQLEKRNRQLEAASGGLASIADLQTKLRQLVQKNKRLQKEVDNCKARERRLESDLGLESRRCSEKR